MSMFQPTSSGIDHALVACCLIKSMELLMSMFQPTSSGIDHALVACCLM